MLTGAALSKAIFTVSTLDYAKVPPPPPKARSPQFRHQPGRLVGDPSVHGLAGPCVRSI